MTTPDSSRIPAAARLALGLLLASASVVARNAPSNVSTPEDIQKDFAAVPCDDKDRLAAVRALYERAGASASDITMDQHDGETGSGSLS